MHTAYSVYVVLPLEICVDYVFRWVIKTIYVLILVPLTYLFCSNLSVNIASILFTIITSAEEVLSESIKTAMLDIFCYIISL